MKSRQPTEEGGHWFGNQYVRPRSKKMSHSPEQNRQKEEAMKKAEHHSKMNVVGERAGNGDTFEQGYLREMSERKNDPEHYDEQGYRRLSKEDLK